MAKTGGEDLDGEVFEQAVLKAMADPALGEAEKITLENILLSRKMYKSLVHKGVDLPAYEDWMERMMRKGLTRDSREIYDTVNGAMRNYPVVVPPGQNRWPGR